MKFHYDIIVIGAGHAGCEAAVSAARLGSSVLLITMDMNKIAQMSCNPSIGGIAKGQIIREIDAMGGFSAIVTDASTIQFRMLNRSKGPAMWSPRAQCDRMLFSMCWRKVLESTSGLELWQDSVTSVSLSGSHISSVTTSMGVTFTADAYILTAGTFLNGKIFIGSEQTSGGRVGEPSSYFISNQLQEAGITIGRMKTGTPPRVDVRTVDLSRLLLQTGDPEPAKFSFLNYKTAIQNGRPQKNCYIAHTNLKVHETLKSAFHLSPLFSGKISGTGPRYCPSIEDKLRTFADKNEHQIFLEPEGWDTHEYYLQGFSSSLPFQTQIDALRQVEGFEQVHLYRPGYAIEYDYFDPTLLYPSLQSKILSNLFLAGQVNGTTGYEEAAAQGLYAGINAHRYVHSLSDFILRRDSSYIGVLVDDLVTKGVDEPYRMFTSRAEYRILLRQDNAESRLTDLSFNIGLADKYRMRLFRLKQRTFNDQKKVFDQIKPPLSVINPFLKLNNTSSISNIKSLSSLVVRPQLLLSDLLQFVPRGTLLSLKRNSRIRFSSDPSDAIRIFHLISSESLTDKECKNVFDVSLGSVEILLKYSGYIDRELSQAQKIKNLESLKIPSDFDYSRLTSISMESRMKLSKLRPQTIAQASRIPGVSPADISVLLIYFGR